MKKAFTLTELLIAMGVIGLLAAMLMPIVKNLIPDQNVVLAKKSYYIIQNAISEMINDTGCYPDKTGMTGSDYALGFDDGYGYPECHYGGTVAKYSIETPVSSVKAEKFRTLFMRQIGALNDNETILDKTGMDPDYRTTKDGMLWDFFVCHDCGWKRNDIYGFIYVDVDGNQSGDNCVDTNKNYYGANKCSTGKIADTVVYVIYPDGTIECGDKDSWGCKAIKASTSVTGEN